VMHYSNILDYHCLLLLFISECSLSASYVHHDTHCQHCHHQLASLPSLCTHPLWRFAIQQRSTAPQSGHALLTQVRSMCSRTLPCASSLVPSVLLLSHGFQCSPTLNRQPYEERLPLTSWWKKIVKHESWPIQPDILSPPLLRLTSRKLLWLDLQPVDIKSRWKHNWKSAQVVNSHLVCNPTIWQPGFNLPRQ